MRSVPPHNDAGVEQHSGTKSSHAKRASLIVAPNDIVEAVNASLDVVTKVFDRYRLHPNFEDRCSPFGDRQERARRLAAQNPDTWLRDLAYYETAALSTMGGVADLKQFLPSILAAMTDGLAGGSWFGLGIGFHADIFSKLTAADVSDWPDNERSSISAFIDAYWMYLLSTYSCAYPPIDYFASVIGIHAGKSLLSQWANAPGLAPVLHLAAARVVAGDELAEGLAEWVHSDDALARILGAEPVEADPLGDEYAWLLEAI